MTKLIRYLCVSGILLTSCGGGDDSGGMRGRVRVDGSSTVFPITEAVAEEFQKVHRGVQVTVGISGTGGGFKKFAAGETDINDASRPIKPIEEEAAKANSVQYIELPVAFDGISVVANPENDFLDHLTVEELRKIWQPGSMVNKWSDIRSEWPDRQLNLYGPGTDSGTFDYFTEAVNGKSQVCRPDFTASEDDNVLVQGISGDPDALGFFGFAYYAENASRLKLIPIDGGDGPVYPSNETINTNTYNPLSRPIFIYVNDQARREEVVAFVEFYLREAPNLVQEVGYVALPAEVYELALHRFTHGITGTVYGGGHAAGASLLDLFQVGG